MVVGMGFAIVVLSISQWRGFTAVDQVGGLEDEEPQKLKQNVRTIFNVLLYKIF